MNNVYLFYPQYQDGDGAYSSHWLPYTITALWAYVEQFDDIKQNFDVRDVIFRRDPIDQVVDKLDNPALCLFSTYTWNQNYNRLLAQAIKHAYPECCIVFGGPQLSEDATAPVEDYVDSYVIKEGENSLLNLLRDFRKGYIDPIYKLSKRTAIEHSPSPYVDSDLMNRVVKNNPTIKWAMVMETNRGCPFGCTFCDWGSLTQNKIKKYNLDRVLREIDWLCANNVEYVYIADANYGALYDRDLEITNYIAKKKTETGYPYVLNVNWYKNSTKKIINLNKILDSVGLSRGMTLSVQSMNETVLKNVDRANMGINNLKEMYAECNRNNVRFYTEFILGLPGETLNSFQHGLGRVIDLGCHTTIDVYPFEMMPNAPAQKQIAQFELDVYQYPDVIPGQPTEIVEYFNVVRSTKDMPAKDMAQAWVWAWTVHNMHYYNWTQMLCRFARRHLDISAVEFYRELWNDVIMRNNYIRDEYLKRREMVERVLFPQQTDTSELLNLTHYAEQHIWHDHKESIYQDIAYWANNYFCTRHGVSEQMLDQVLRLNMMYNTDRDRTQPAQETFQYNLYEYIVDDVKLKQQPCVYEFKNKIDFATREEFNVLIYRRHTFGFSQQQVTRLPNV